MRFKIKYQIDKHIKFKDFEHFPNKIERDFEFKKVILSFIEKFNPKNANFFKEDQESMKFFND